MTETPLRALPGPEPPVNALEFREGQAVRVAVGDPGAGQDPWAALPWDDVDRTPGTAARPGALLLRRADPTEPPRVVRIAHAGSGTPAPALKVARVVTAAGPPLLRLAAGGPGTLLIVVIRPHPGRSRWALDHNVTETDQHIRHLPGFMGTVFLTGPAGARGAPPPGDVLVELALWESDPALAAAHQDERFRAHVHRVARHAHVEADRYEVLHASRTA